MNLLGVSYESFKAIHGSSPKHPSIHRKHLYLYLKQSHSVTDKLKLCEIQTVKINTNNNNKQKNLNKENLQKVK